MFKKLFCIITLMVFLFACGKTPASTSSTLCPYTKPTTVAPAAEVAALKHFLDSTGVTSYSTNSSGFFYNITTQGAGDTATVCSGVLVKYKGQLTNGTGFDSSYVNYPDGIGFTLGGLITGWQIGIPLIQKGGSITLYLPPSLGYGATASGKIPANSNLIFTINLLDLHK